jgi:hypothetical protein
VKIPSQIPQCSSPSCPKSFIHWLEYIYTAHLAGERSFDAIENVVCTFVSHEEILCRRINQFEIAIVEEVVKVVSLMLLDLHREL